MKIHCLFEQSGTFKNEFKKLGYEAYDYDILNDYGQTDYQIDLFEEIHSAYSGGGTIFDTFSQEDIVLAFFPCTYFQSYHSAWFLCKAPNCRNMTDIEKLEMVHDRHEKLHRNYELFTEMCWVALKKGIKLIIENPYTQPHYLTRYFPIEPKFIDSDRTKRGDWYRKPTQYWFLNCNPRHNLIFEPMVIRQRKVVNHPDESDNTKRARERSEISPEYANRFIREFIITQTEEQQ